MGLLPQGSKIKEFSFYPKSVHKWIKGDDSGNEDIVEKVSEGFVVYKSGRRCSLDLIQEYMDPVSVGPDPAIEAKKKRDALTAGLEVDEVDPEKLAEAKAREEAKNKADKKAELEKQLKELDSQESTIKNTHKPNKEIVKETPKNPVRLILEANQNSTIKPIQVSIPVPIPEQDVIDLLKTSFPTYNIEKEIVELAMTMVSGDDVKKIIELNIKTLLENGSSTNI